jgi:hypothetical protein
MTNPYVMPFTQGQEFSNWQRYAGAANPTTGEYEFGSKPPQTGVLPPASPVAPEIAAPDYSFTGVAPASSMGAKPTASFGAPASTFGFGQSFSLKDAVSKHLGD